MRHLLTLRVSLVTDFLEYARRQPLEWERKGAREYLDEIVMLLGSDLDDHGVTLQRAETASDLDVTLDGDRMRRVMINLVRNAGQASEPVEIRLGTAPGSEP